MERNRGRLFAFGIALFFTSAWPVHAASYYVAPTGKDTNSGALDSPWQTISHGISVMGAGDTIWVRSGTYPAFSVTKSNITISAYNNESVKINASGAWDGILLKGTSYVGVYGFEVTGAAGNYGAGITVMNNGTTYPTYNIIKNNLVHDNVGVHTQGIMVQDGSYNKIMNNKVFNNYNSGIIVIAEKGMTLKRFTGNEITGNRSYNNVLGGGNTDGIKLEGGGVTGTLISNNVVYGNGDDGIDTWNTTGNTVINNIAYDQVGPGDGNGFKMGGYTLDSSGIKNYGGGNTIKGNTSYNNRYNGFDSNGSGANYYENNIAYHNGFTSTSNNAWGLQDSYRENGDNRPSSLINNNSYNNKTANYITGTYTTVFTGNTEIVPTSSPKPGDANGDNKVDGVDYVVWLNHYNQTISGGNTVGDFNASGKVDGVDYVVWVNNYGK